MPKLSQKPIQQILVPLPNIETQEKIISLLESFDSRYNYLSNLIGVELDKAVLLKNSILKSAFIGKLVPQNEFDESAHILIERIKEENVKIGKTKNFERR